MDSNDSPVIPDRGKTSDIPGLSSRADVAENSNPPKPLREVNLLLKKQYVVWAVLNSDACNLVSFLSNILAENL